MAPPQNLPIVTLIPARAGSKGVAGKNIRPLAGKPLYRHAVDQAREAGLSDIFITTDIEKILSADLPDGTKAIRRAPGLTGDNTPMAAVIANFLQTTVPHPATIVLLQPTTPLRQAQQIKEAIDHYHANGTSMLQSVCKTSSSILKSGTIENGTYKAMRSNKNCFQNRQSLPDVYAPNGAIYVFDADRFRAQNDFYSDRIVPYLMDETSSIDIDIETDFQHCEALLNQRSAAS